MGEPDPLDRVDIEWCGIRPWHDDAFVRRWLDDNRLPFDPDHRRELLEVTGGWPVLHERFVTHRRTAEWKKRIDGMTNVLAKPSERKKLLNDFGIVSPDAKRQMRTLCDSASAYGEETVADIADEAQIDTTLLRRRMEWSERLGLVTRTADNSTFNSLVTRLLADE